MLNELNGDSNFTAISEVPGKGHWFDGIVDDATIQEFFDRHVVARHSLPLEFELKTMNPATFGGRGGIRILQLILPYRQAAIRVSRNDDVWLTRTTNVKRFKIARIDTVGQPRYVVIDGFRFAVNPKSDPAHHFCRDENVWQICASTLWTRRERNPKNYGPARQV
jgi:hypothetical protein